MVLDLPADFPESCIWKAISEFPWGIIKRATDTKSSSSSSPWRRDADPQPSTGKSSSSSSNSWVRDEGPQPSIDNWWSSNSRWSDEDPQHALKLPQRQAPPPPKKTEVTLIPRSRRLKCPTTQSASRAHRPIPLQGKGLRCKRRSRRHRLHRLQPQGLVLNLRQGLVRAPRSRIRRVSGLSFGRTKTC